MSNVYVYRLDITYPPGSEEPGWQPEGWEPQEYQITSGPDAGAWDSESFRWPRERMYFSKSGAEGRADLFRKYGAKVTVRRSHSVTWPGLEEELDALKAAFAKLQKQTEVTP
jgi:hypothetical protein